ncbi:MAG: hypothetical protein JOY86_02185 [Candidatus Eremiobacteraeota bacterium]|nr:hypothetical protein [Candidatus Eremiobacteraeota bacterium]
MRARLRAALVALATSIVPFVAACGGSGGTSAAPPAPTSPATQPPATQPPPTPAPGQSYVYYSTENSNPSTVQIGAIRYPVTNASVPAVAVTSSNLNQLGSVGQMQVDSSGRLFAAGFGIQQTVFVFETLPLSSSSIPFPLYLPAGVSGPDPAIAFDSAGNLWVSANGAGIYEFKAPFPGPAILSPSITLKAGGCAFPVGLAFDRAGNLWVACGNSAGANSVAEFLKGAGFSSSTPIDHYLNGPVRPFALIFDGAGDLYVGSQHAAPTGGIALYKSTNLAAGATPDVYNATGQLSSVPFPFQLAFDPAGNLYDADCSSPARLYVYPTAAHAFSSSLAPSAVYTDANINAAACTAGVAIH